MKQLIILVAIVISFYSMNVFAAGGPTSPLVTPEWLNSHLDNKDLVIIEVRSGETSIKYTDEHMPGSVFASSVYFWTNLQDTTNIPNDIPPKEEFEKLVRKLGINDNSNIVIVSPGLVPKDIMCSTRTYWTFAYYGMTNISILDGGFGKWKKSGYAVSNKIEEPAMGNFSVKMENTSVLANLGDVKSAAASNKWVLLDSRMNSDYTGATKQPFVPAAGHIAGAINYFAPLFLNPDLTFKSDKQISYEMSLLGITKDKSIISYCNSGQFATTAWFALNKIAGIEHVSSYDGSVAEWVNKGNLPLDADKTSAIN